MIRYSFFLVLFLFISCNSSQDLERAIKEITKSSKELTNQTDQLLCDIQELNCLNEILEPIKEEWLNKELCIRIKGKYPCYYNSTDKREVEIEKIKQVLTDLSIECRDKKWPENKDVCALIRKNKTNDSNN